MAGAGLGVKLSQMYGLDKSTASAITGIAALFLSFVFIRITGNRMAGSDAYKPKIIRIKKPLPEDERWEE